MIKSQEEYEKMRQRVTALGYEPLTEDQVFTPLFQEILAEVAGLVRKQFNTDEETQAKIDSICDSIQGLLYEKFPNITASTATSCYALLLLDAAARLAFTSSGNDLRQKVN